MLIFAVGAVSLLVGIVFGMSLVLCEGDETINLIEDGLEDEELEQEEGFLP